MSWNEHLAQAEALLRESEQDLATAQTQREHERVLIQVQLAIGHALCADAKKLTR